MKTTTKVLTSFVAVGVLASAFFFNSTGASQSAEQQAEKAVEHYLNSVKSGNVAEMMKYSKDIRFSDDAERKSIYEGLVRADQLKKVELLKIEATSDTEANATIRWTEKDAGTHEMTLPVIKEGDQWKVLVEGQKYEKNDIQE